MYSELEIKQLTDLMSMMTLTINDIQIFNIAWNALNYPGFEPAWRERVHTITNQRELKQFLTELIVRGEPVYPLRKIAETAGLYNVLYTIDHSPAAYLFDTRQQPKTPQKPMVSAPIMYYDPSKAKTFYDSLIELSIPINELSALQTQAKNSNMYYWTNFADANALKNKILLAGIFDKPQLIILGDMIRKLDLKTLKLFIDSQPDKNVRQLFIPLPNVPTIPTFQPTGERIAIPQGFSTFLFQIPITATMIPDIINIVRADKRFFARDVNNWRTAVDLRSSIMNEFSYEQQNGFLVKDNYAYLYWILEVIKATSETEKKNAVICLEFIDNSNYRYIFV